MMRWFSLALMLGFATLGHAERPNIVLFLADDLGYGELGCQGNPQIPTPHIDSIAKNGIRFTQGYVSSPYCCPSRAGLMTGRYQTRFGHEMNAVGKMNLQPVVGLPLTEKTIADFLKKADYTTACIGKWHLGGTPKFHPLERGFDTFYGFLHEGHFYVPPPYDEVVSHLREKEPPYDANNPVLRGRKPIIEKEYMTDALTREALAFLDEQKDKPFFLYLSYSAVHSPMQALPSDLKRFAHIKDKHRRVFAAMLASMDDSVGAVLDKLQEKKIDKNTLVIFLSDNGGPTAELTSSNAPLRGGKGQVYEGGIRIPFLMQWKGTLPTGRVYEKPVISLDLLPTALAAAKFDPPKSLRLDGVNLLPYLKGEKSSIPHETLYWRLGSNRNALRMGAWKILRQGYRGKLAPLQLFDLSKDIAESADRIEENAEVANRLRSELDKMNDQMIEPLWGRR